MIRPETQHVPQPSQWIPPAGTPARAQDEYRSLLRDLQKLVDVVGIHSPGPALIQALHKCAGCGRDRPWPCLPLTEAVAEIAIATGVDLYLQNERDRAASTGGAGGAAAGRPTGPALVELSDRVLVIPGDVAAVIEHPDFPCESRVYIRAAGTAPLRVDRPMNEIAELLATHIT